MRVLLVHNSYRQRGGEDAVYESEVALLRAAGHEVVEYRRHNHEVDGVHALRLLGRTLWSRESHAELQDLAREARPDVAHFHNTLPLISPAGYHAVRSVGVPVVQTLHNFRLVCPSALLYRAGSVCEDCVGRSIAWPAVLHGCYRGSRGASGAVAMMLGFHRLRGTWRRDVDLYVALTPFARDEILAGGIVPDERVTVLPNFLATDPGPKVDDVRRGVLYVGRLTEEKGLRVLLQAIERLPSDVGVTIVGSGPLATEVHAAAAHNPRLRYLGELGHEAVLHEMRKARVLAFPSVWFEGFPMTLVEAFACGLPVVGSRIGGVPSIVREGEAGRTVRPGDAQELGDALMEIEQDAALAAALSVRAREVFESRYGAESHLRGLEAIYRAAIEAFRSGEAPRVQASHSRENVPSSADADAPVAGASAPHTGR